MSNVPSTHTSYRTSSSGTCSTEKKSDPELVEGTELEKINIEKHESRPRHAQDD